MHPSSGLIEVTLFLLDITSLHFKKVLSKGLGNLPFRKS